ncbi:GNAT family N-acetyltransferase [Thermoactinomyces sp. AMNI-1]|uniref:GNAT family N-acetyltransferase n=2 Tax=Thermoactinomyces mirandus TaxID=2756294 RepID=A0A7W1XRE4_9BACL|nr:GNAT family N-acetyltransferase [Thermoactinomyces mirandus]
MNKDSLEEMTRLLNEAYSMWLARGLKYVAATQSVEITRARIKDAVSLVGWYQQKMIGTITYYSPEINAGCDWYDREGVGRFGQFATHPDYRKLGIGSKLLERVENMARSEGVDELALDTAKDAVELIQYYKKKGYRFIQYVDWNITNYRSVVLSKKMTL